MYLPKHFEETRIEVLHELIRARPLGALVALTASGLEANHIPFEIDPQPQPYGTLRGHVARANPIWREHSRDVEALVIFQGAGAYISPAWYPSKPESGKVVPTWNYVVVHARGALQAIDDKAWLRAFVGRLTSRHEASFPEPWKITDAPPDYLEQMLGAIVGIEMRLTSLTGKWKVSQNRSAEDRQGVVSGLLQQSGETAAAMAALVHSKLPADTD